MTDFPFIEDTRPTHRIINSRWPSVGLFDTLVDDEVELRQLFELEMSANPRNQKEVGRLAQIPEGGIVMGETANMVMAAFVHCHEDGGRFNSGRLGAWYAAYDVDTAIAETAYHQTKRLALSEGGFPQQMQMRQLMTSVSTTLMDVRGQQDNHADLYDREDYGQSQSFADRLRWPYSEDGIDGLVYDSMRREGGTNICVFRPHALERPITQGDHFQYVWDKDGRIYIDKLTNIVRPD